MYIYLCMRIYRLIISSAVNSARVGIKQGDIADLLWC